MFLVWAKDGLKITFKARGSSFYLGGAHFRQVLNGLTVTPSHQRGMSRPLEVDYYIEAISKSHRKKVASKEWGTIDEVLDPEEAPYVSTVLDGEIAKFSEGSNLGQVKGVRREG